MSKPDFNSHTPFRSFGSKPNYKNDLPPDQLKMIYGETPKEKTPKEKKRKKKNTPSETAASRQRVSNTTAGSTTTPTKQQRVEVIEIGMLYVIFIV